MAFYATRFTFGGVPSENYSLTISSESDSESSTSLPGNIKIFSEKLFRKTEEYLYGVSIEPVLEFPVKFMTDNIELTAQDLELVNAWLFGKKNYEKLYIMQEDMQNVYFYCFMVDPKIIRVGNLVRGVSCSVRCKYPWAITEPKTFSYSTSPIRHYNASDDTGYTYPQTVITASIFGGTVSIVNTSDNNRTLTFTGLSANEVLTIDNNLQIITSSTGLKRLSNFNKNFFRLVRGENQLTMTNIASLNIVYPLAKKIGG